MVKNSIGGVVFASSLGTIVDYYDLFIVSTAASLVWPSIFFTGLSATVKVSLSVITFGIVYITRPLGAIIFGHYGDRIGRRNMMVWTLILTVIGIGGIAALPDASVIGVSAAVGSLVTLRLVQGIGLGGEWPAASSLTLEYVALSKHRAFLTSWIQNGVNIGILLASLMFTLITTVFTHAQLLDYAWRIPFIIGIVILGVAIFIRLRIAETPLFENLKKENKIEKLPLLDSIKEKWKTLLLLIPAAFFVVGAPGIFVSGPYVIDFVTRLKTISDPQMSLAVAAASGIGIFFALAGSFLGDKIGRRLTLLISSVFVVVFLYPFELLLNTMNYGAIVIAIVLLNGFFKIADGITPTMFAEQFETKYRFSGSGLAYQLGSLVLGIISITLIPYVVGASHGVANSIGLITIVGIIAAALTAATAFVITETKEKKVV